ncbi:hypothetical protein HU200_060937 [Digitaria exilis]|uniref:Uncharacterized protein n=1 Tax=Digitaria exilis TaxID=1010633 RepID=A0A835DX25_9POAL|nr:hypothetical protein HU200_060937 [Digitaria exilis]
MPTITNPLKRPSAGGRLLASLRPPARPGPLPVQTGFPTSLADLVVKNHDRLKKPRRRHRAPPPVTSPEPPVAPLQRRQLSTAQSVAALAPAAAFSIRPELLAVGGVMALALLVIWSKLLVAAATVASVALFWIESVSVGSPASHRGASPETKRGVDSRGGSLVSPFQEVAESPDETPRPRSAASDTGSEVSVSSLCLWPAADTIDIAGEDPDSISPNNKRKEKRRSLRKLLAKKLQNGKRRRNDKDSRHGGESEHPPVAGEVSAAETAVVAAPAEETSPLPEPEAVADERRHRRRGGALPLTTFVPLILVGLVAGKLPAVVLTVLCAVFFTSSVDRVPDAAARASGHGSDPR